MFAKITFSLRARFLSSAFLTLTKCFKAHHRFGVMYLVGTYLTLQLNTQASITISLSRWWLSTKSRKTLSTLVSTGLPSCLAKARSWYKMAFWIILGLKLVTKCRFRSTYPKFWVTSLWWTCLLSCWLRQIMATSISKARKSSSTRIEYRYLSSGLAI